MKAMVQDRYGDAGVLELRDVPRPSVGADGVLVRVRAASVNPLDWHFMRGEPLVMRLAGVGLRRPKRRIQGADVAGTVEAVGPGVRSLAPGDDVLGWATGGGFAEYVVVPEDHLVPKPAGLGFEAAGAIAIAGITALQAVRDHGQVGPDTRVLVVGASGGVGTFAVQIAKTRGAHVTGVCSTRNLELVRSLGADDVLDYTRGDLSAGGRRFDVVLHVAGDRAIRERLRLVEPDGVLVNVGGGEGGGVVFGPVRSLVAATVARPFVRPRVRSFLAAENQADAMELLGLIEEGSVVPVIDRTYALVEVPEAIRYVESLRARGKVVVTI
ncbi:MAG: NAD(P)-dependent alcohol dehydrogenase [Actinobacteria bacterium]|nr:NAD(P)-dependent alcohol dehydrogenase [Actinomycetota bacterium]